jgi:hypothetical protein
MIVRVWRGTVPTARADAFRVHLETTGVADYRAAGASEIRVLRRVDGRTTDFLLLSTWADMAAVRAFAGTNPEVAVLYPEDDAYGLVPDRHVTHYEIDEVPSTTAAPPADGDRAR